jgi:signal transduction histidine kinase/ActR/RegA family two-component response regulator
MVSPPLSLEPDFRVLFESAPGLYLVLLPGGQFTIVAVSEAYLRATMTRREQIVGRGLFEVFPDNPDDPEATGVSNLRASLLRVLETGTADTMPLQKYDIRRPEAEGGGFEERYWSPVNSPVFDAGGEITHIIHRVEDVTEFVRLKQHGTEQHRLTEELRDRTDKMEAEIFLRAQQLAEANQQLRAANEELARLYKRTQELDRLKTQFFVQERKHTEHALRDREEHLHLALRAGRMGSWDHDLGSGRFTCSEGTEELLGFPPGTFDCRLETFLTCVHPEDRDAVFRLLCGMVEDVADYETEFRITLPGGDIRWISARGRVLADASARPARVVGVGMDITRRRGSEEALRQADRRKDEFLAMLAHELRNPLAPILNATQVLRLRAPDDPVLHRHQEIIERQARHLARLVDDLLEVSRITEGKIGLQWEVVDLSRVVEQAVELAQPLIQAEEHHLEVSLPAEPVRIHADPARIQQVIANLLNNAAKYTVKGGQIWLSVEVGDGGQGSGVRGRRDAVDSSPSPNPQPPSPGEAVIRVRDTGIGISPEVLPLIFDLFVQADRSLDRAQGGLGIGLTMVRSLVEMHGGSVAVDSRGLGMGSEFTVVLPALPAPVACEAGRLGGVRAQESVRTETCRVLVVDDNVDAAQTVADLLELWGHEPHTAHHGPAALRLADEIRPQVILLDIGLPEMDGYEIARRLREGKAASGAFLVAVTGYGQEDDRRRTAEAGFHEHLIKPVEPEALQCLLARLSEQR